MLNPIVSCTIYGIEMLIIYIFLSRIAEKQKKPTKCLLLGLLLFELGSCGNLLFQNNVLVNTFVSLSIKVLFATLCFEIKPLAAACYSVILEVLNFALELASIFAISALIRADTADLNSNLALVTVSTFTSKTLLFLTCLILSRLVNPKSNHAKTPMNLFYYPVSVAICLGIFWYICAQSGTTFLIQSLLAIASGIIFVSTLLLFITYQHQIEENSELIRLRSEFDRLQTEKSYYDILEQQNQNLMIYAHDTKKHLAAIQTLTNDPAINGYLTKLSDQLRDYSKNCHSGNMMLDVMINKYVLDCSRLGIYFDYNVRSCNLNVLEDIDLVAILGNLMDNAVEASEKSVCKLISLETTIRNGYSVIVVSNSCDTPPKTYSGYLITSKNDKKLHGYGLKSVAKTLRQYRGDFRWEFDVISHTFITTVMIGEKHS